MRQILVRTQVQAGRRKGARYRADSLAGPKRWTSGAGRGQDEGTRRDEGEAVNESTFWIGLARHRELSVEQKRDGEGGRDGMPSHLQVKQPSRLRLSLACFAFCGT